MSKTTARHKSIRTKEKLPKQTSSKFEAWFAQLKQMKNDDQILFDPEMIIARFGIKSEIDMAIYLRSRLGHVAQTILENELEIIEAKKQNTIMEQRHLNREHRQLLALLAALLYEREIKAKEYIQNITESVEQSLETAEKIIAEKAQELDAEAAHEKLNSVSELLVQQALFVEAETGLYHELDESCLIGDGLIEDFKKLEEELPAIDMRYKAYEKELDNLETKVLKEFSLDALENELADIEKKLSTAANEIVQSLDNNQDAAAHEQLQKCTALNLRAAQLRDMRDAMKGNHVLLDENLKEVDCFLNAKFIVPKDKTLTHKDGKYYLHNKEEHFTHLSKQQKKEANEQFERSHQQLLTVSKQLQLNHQQELALHAERKNALIKSSENLQDKVDLLMDQLTKVQSTRKILTNKIKQSELTEKAELQQETNASSPKEEMEEEKPSKPTPKPVPKGAEEKEDKKKKTQNKSAIKPKLSEHDKLEADVRNRIVYRTVELMYTLILSTPTGLTAQNHQPRVRRMLDLQTVCDRLLEPQDKGLPRQENTTQPFSLHKPPATLSEKQMTPNPFKKDPFA